MTVPVMTCPRRGRCRYALVGRHARAGAAARLGRRTRHPYGTDIGLLLVAVVSSYMISGLVGPYPWGPPANLERLPSPVDRSLGPQLPPARSTPLGGPAIIDSVVPQTGAEGLTYPTWVNITNESGSPADVVLPMVAPDPAHGAVIEEGGLECTNLSLSQSGCGQEFPSLSTWEYSHGAWTNLTGVVGLAPPAMSTDGLGAFAFDNATGTDVLWTGLGLAAQAYSTVMYPSTWVLGSSGWENLSLPPAEQPSNVSWMAYDPVNEYLVAVTTNAHTWSFAGNRWAELNATLDPTLNPDAVSMAWDPATQCLVLEGAGGAANATWTFVNGSWTNVTTPTSAVGGPANSQGSLWYLGAPMVYDPGASGMISYGAFGYPGAAETSWLWTNSTWINITAQVGGPTPPFIGNWDTTGTSFPGGDYSIFLVPSSPELVRNAAVWALTDGPLVFLHSAPSLPEVGRPLALTGTYLGGGTIASSQFAGLPPGCASPTSVDFSCVPSVAGFYTVTLTVTDAHGLFGSGSTSFTVGPALAVSFSVSTTLLDLGQPWNLGAYPTGGGPPYTYSIDDFPGPCAVTTSGFGCVANATGSFPVHATVTDQAGESGSWNGSVTVNPPPRVLLKLGQVEVEVGEADQFNWTIAGGSPPLAVRLTGAPGGCAPTPTPPLPVHPDRGRNVPPEGERYGCGRGVGRIERDPRGGPCLGDDGPVSSPRVAGFGRERGPFRGELDGRDRAGFVFISGPAARVFGGKHLDRRLSGGPRRSVGRDRDGNRCARVHGPRERDA